MLNVCAIGLSQEKMISKTGKITFEEVDFSYTVKSSGKKVEVETLVDGMHGQITLLVDCILVCRCDCPFLLILLI